MAARSKLADVNWRVGGRLSPYFAIQLIDVFGVAAAVSDAFVAVALFAGKVKARSDRTARKDDGSWDVLARPNNQFGLNREPRVAEPARDLSRRPMVTLDVDRATGVTLRRVLCFVTDVKPDQ
jgi:hypothetical protein